MTEQFISEAIRPDIKTMDTARMAAGEPGLPQVFHWRTQTLRLARVVRTWRETGPCHHGSGEMYVRKHWFEVVTDDGQTLKLYFERQPRSGKIRTRWWLFSIEKASPARHDGSCPADPRQVGTNVKNRASRRGAENGPRRKQCRPQVE